MSTYTSWLVALTRSTLIGIPSLPGASVGGVDGFDVGTAEGDVEGATDGLGVGLALALGGVVGVAVGEASSGVAEGCADGALLTVAHAATTVTIANARRMERRVGRAVLDRLWLFMRAGWAPQPRWEPDERPNRALDGCQCRSRRALRT